MLLNFSISNFKSLEQDVTLSLLKDRKYPKLEENVLFFDTIDKKQANCVAGIYGKNGSGKTTIIEALLCCIKYITSPQSADCFSKKCFAFSKNVCNIVDFTITFSVDEKIYTYAVSLDTSTSEILKESLKNTYKAKTKNTTQSLFSREKGKESTFALDTFEDDSVKDGWLKYVQSDELFLQKHENFKNIIEYLKNRVFFLCPQYEKKNILEAVLDNTISIPGLNEYFEKFYPAYKNDTAEILGAVDISFKEIIYKEQEESIIDSLKKQIKRFEIKQNYGEKSATFSPRELSHGTNILADISPLLSHVLQHGNIVFIDELSRGISEDLVLFIIDLFKNPSINKKGAQLVFSDHNTRIIDSLSPNQLYLAIKDNQTGSTDIYRPFEFSDFRYDQASMRNLAEGGEFHNMPNTYVPDLKGV